MRLTKPLLDQHSSMSYTTSDEELPQSKRNLHSRNSDSLSSTRAELSPRPDYVPAENEPQSKDNSNSTSDFSDSLSNSPESDQKKEALPVENLAGGSGSRSSDTGLNSEDSYNNGHNTNNWGKRPMGNPGRSSGGHISDVEIRKSSEEDE